MKAHTVSLLAIGAVIVCGPVAAQVSTTPEPRLPPAPRPMQQQSAFTQMSRFEQEEARRRFGGSEAEQVARAEERYGADRVELARQVQVLMDQGDCSAARRLASSQGERSMALNVRRTCRTSGD